MKPPSRRILVALVFVLLPLLRAAGDVVQPPNPLVVQALAAEARFDSAAALELFLRADAQHANDPVVLQKISRQYSDLSNDTTDLAEKKRLLALALDYTNRAVVLAPKSAVNVLSLAIIYGKLALLADTRAKIEDSRLVKRYAEEALALDPDYAFAHHVLGRWHYEVATLGSTKRFLVRLIYGGLPEASTAEAVRQLRRAVELSPELPAHRAELGFALLADGQRDAARAEFEQALALPRREKYDAEAQQRAREALAHFSR